MIEYYLGNFHNHRGIYMAPTEQTKSDIKQTVAEVYNDFISKVENNPRVKKDIEDIKRAYKMAYDAHTDQLRKSGEPYIIHPILVSTILLELGMDSESVVAGLLHDTIEDTVYTYEDIEQAFGTTVAKLVNGVTKLLKIEYKKDGVKNQNLQAENYRKMFLAMADDVRIIVIKMADRLHNMRTLNYMTAEKQKRKAQETMDIYAPLALRLGISRVRNELEDLCFKYLEPQAYHDLAEKVQKKQTQRQSMIDEMVRELDEQIKNSSFMEVHNCDFDIKGRPKHFFSIYKKMKTKDMSLEQIYDLFAVRIIVDTEMQCYGILGAIHEKYKPLPDRFKDYISVPKSNGYKSLHTTVIGKNGEPFEIQIRTKDMHRIAEYGIAAHWKYKDKPNTQVDMASDEAKLGVISSGIKRILELQEELSQNINDNDEEYLEELKTELDIYKGSIYCYTPNGDVIEIKAGSTPVDFAYAIHSAIGNTMVGAKVNGLIVTFEHRLSTGDRVEILTSRNSVGPKAEWLTFVQTSQARNRIKNALKSQNQEENHDIGKELLEVESEKRKYDIDDLLSAKSKIYILSRYNYTDWDLFLAAVGRRAISEEQVIKHLIAYKDREDERIRKLELKNMDISSSGFDVSSLITQPKQRNKSKSGVVIQGLGDVGVRFSRCCSPLPGDEIVGYITRGRGVSVHRTDCVNVITMPDDEKARMIDTYWELKDATVRNKYSVELSIEGDDSAGLLVTISTIINDHRINITNMNVRANGTIATIITTLDVESKEQVDKLCDRIQSLKEVHSIKR